MSSIQIEVGDNVLLIKRNWPSNPGGVMIAKKVGGQIVLSLEDWRKLTAMIKSGELEELDA